MVSCCCFGLRAGYKTASNGRVEICPGDHFTNVVIGALNLILHFKINFGPDIVNTVTQQRDIITGALWKQCSR